MAADTSIDAINEIFNSVFKNDIISYNKFYSKNLDKDYNIELIKENKISISEYPNGFAFTTYLQTENKENVYKYPYLGCYSIEDLHLSGKIVYTNVYPRFMFLFDSPIDTRGNYEIGNYILGTNVLLLRGSSFNNSLIRTDFDENSEITKIVFPEFDESIYKYCVLAGYFGSNDGDHFDKLPNNFNIFLSFENANYLELDEYSKIYVPNKEISDYIISQIPKQELNLDDLTPNILTKNIKISTNLANPEETVEAWLNGNNWQDIETEVGSAYYTTGFIKIPDSKKIILNVKTRTCSCYINNYIPTEYAFTYSKNKSVASGFIDSYTTNEIIHINTTKAHNVLDLSALSSNIKYIRIGFFKDTYNGFLYVADAENYDPYFLEPYSIEDNVSYSFVDDIVINESPSQNTNADLSIDINPKTADYIMMIGDSYTESHYTVPGKAYVCKLSEFSDYNFENLAQSGDIYYGNIDRIRNRSNIYGYNFQEVNPRYAMMCCFTNDIKTLTAMQYGEALRAACRELLGRGCEPLIFTEYHAANNSTSIASINHQVAKEFGLSDYDITCLVKLIRGSDYAAFWGGSHPGTRPNAIESDNYEKYISKLERPHKSCKLFRIRDGFSYSDISELIFYNNEERAKRFKEIMVGHTAITNSALVDNCTTASNSQVISEYHKLRVNEAVQFNDIALVSFVIPSNSNNTKSLVLSLITNNITPTVYIKNITAGNYTRPNRYIRFDYPQSIVTVPTIGAKYKTPGVLNSSGNQLELTVVDIKPGEGDGDAAGYILCSGSFGNMSYNTSACTLTKISGTGDDTIECPYKAIGYIASELSNPDLAGWVEVNINETDGKYYISLEDMNSVIFGDRVDFLIQYSGSFSISDINLKWSGNECKRYQRDTSIIIPNIARSETEILEQTNFGAPNIQNSYWNLTPTTVIDNCYPYGIQSIYTVNQNVSINKQINLLDNNTIWYSGYYILEIWARYFPPIYTNGSGEQITEDSYDYADLIIKCGPSNKYNMEFKERINTHYKICQFEILSGGESSNTFNLNISSNKDLQIAYISLKKIRT